MGALTLDVAVIVATIGGLWIGARLLVDGASALATRLGVSRVVVGLTVVAFGTSMPEFAVTTEAALAGRGDIAVGNVVGSNVFNLGFVLGTTALLGTLDRTRRLVRRDGVALALAAAALLVLIQDGRFTQLEGGLFLLGLLVYLVILVRGGVVETVAEPAEPTRPLVDAARLLAGLVLVVGSARLLVTSASTIAAAAGVSEWAIGVTVVAAGTSTPELVTALVAARRGHSGLSVGGLLGSDLFNILGVLGLAGLLGPLSVSPEAPRSVVWLLGTVMLVVALLWTGRQLTRLEGAALLVLAGIRWAINLL
ncbi:calcium/sodium antiporter [Halapricum hydrolyticum]|uniref:Calcium/sodium antiporter n=1 Tax=Halapricum hydrolyticum TaxID=2979991 RepID=A0AAE3IDD2_9EURY|nr:calcium/sodium antiporter [Halapricum hydrolyticum]MCU4719267.1 calcium/sodium antiporter [Halapricum hydrolyticum]MCU4728548.1 calcium/sodium antiporter [Halapricum hydrolyticum]